VGVWQDAFAQATAIAQFTYSWGRTPTLAVADASDVSTIHRGDPNRSHGRSLFNFKR